MFKFLAREEEDAVERRSRAEYEHRCVWAAPWNCEVVASSTRWKVDSRKGFYTSEKSSYSSIPMPWILGKYVDLVVLETFLTDPEAH